METFDGALSGDSTASFGPLNETLTTYTASSTIPVTKHSEGTKLLSTGAGTFDLTQLPGKTADETVNGTGLKVQFAWFRNPATNANAITITFGASNPYLLKGSAFKMILQPGQSDKFFGDDATPDVGGSSKTIDIAGTGSQGLEYLIVMG